jgi:hypothetical protein
MRANAFMLTVWLLPFSTASAQVVVSGRLLHECAPGSGEWLPMTGILCFASLAGGEAEARGFRTWENEPAGWYRIAGIAGNYTLVFSNPAHFMRPRVLTNIVLATGETVDRNVSPSFSFANFFEGAWDDKPASRYFQTFVATGTGVTQVGLRLAHDGVDGAGPGSQNLLVSIHKRGAGDPDAWERVGPVVPILGVDCGGPKNPVWSAGWNSGEVPLTPGETYAVRIAAELPNGSFQAFWRPDADLTADCFRRGPAGKEGFVGRDLWLAVSTDGDGLLIPYNKRVHQQFVEFAGFGRAWAQTYVARGRALATVILYAAVGGTQPPLSRQRVRITVRRGGPAGETVGTPKIAIGNGNYTGDASWGTLGAAYAPGEVPLAPGETYAISFESVEHRETLSGFVNIKKQASDERPGFNPYRKVPPDAYEHGTAFAGGTEAVGFDLDLQVIEYEENAADWARAVESENLLINGDMESTGGWERFSIDGGTAHVHAVEGSDARNHVLRVAGGTATGTAADGGYVQRAGGLSRAETYRLSGRVRCTWPVDSEHACMIGFDPTGQTADAKAATIVWTVLPAIHGIFVAHESAPIRPAKDAISVWLRARATVVADYPFRADFDDFALRAVRTSVPRAGPH